jgi:hypothetical protein
MPPSWRVSLPGLCIHIRPSVLPGSLILWLLLSLLAWNWLGFGLWPAAGMGLAATLIHWASETFHQLGHAWAARRVGYPMSGIRYWGLLAASLYPPGEGELPARIHIRRALGGPFFSLLLSLACAGVWLALGKQQASPAWWLALFAWLHNLVVFTLQVFIPLKFNDGGTLFYWLFSRR